MDKEKKLIFESLKELTKIVSEQTKVILSLATENKLLEKRIETLENKTEFMKNSEEKVMEYIFSLIGKWIMLIFSLTLVITLILYIKGDIPIIKM
ncbi:hypothetical protein [Fusobacterium periodonticum]|uniref:hypothetical protein n=1 Tax=Fusobacterium periodonticum TaxID=860 RepID=UPI0028D7DB17|nr:hypothetical protein [Fusobacterium periodonticum]